MVGSFGCFMVAFDSALRPRGSLWDTNSGRKFENEALQLHDNPDLANSSFAEINSFIGPRAFPCCRSAMVS